MASERELEVDRRRRLEPPHRRVHPPRWMRHRRAASWWRPTAHVTRSRARLRLEFYPRYGGGDHIGPKRADDGSASSAR
jgi:hypothetical protein